MPELGVLKGWTDWRPPTVFDADRAQGTIPNTPCRGFQWYYYINQDISTTYARWGMDFDILSGPGGEAVFSSSLELPILIMPGTPGLGLPNSWSTSGGVVETAYPEDPPTWQSESEQPNVLPLGNGFVPVQCEVYSAHYLVPLPAGAVFNVRFHSIGAQDLVSSVMLSVLPGGGRKVMLRDPVAGDEYLPRVQNGMLVVRTMLHDGQAGPREGLAVSYERQTGGGGQVHIQSGSAQIGYRDLKLPEAVMLDWAGSLGTQYIFLVPDISRPGTLKAELGAGPPEYAAWCMGRIKNGVYSSCSGVLVADGATEAAAAREENGTLVLRYDTNSIEDLRAVSRDRGVTWETE